jgi:hypothetical protein
MEIHTKYNLGQTLHFLREDKNIIGSINVIEGIVSKINTECFNQGRTIIKTEISYKIEFPAFLNNTEKLDIWEDYLFDSAEDALKFFDRNIRQALKK